MGKVISFSLFLSGFICFETRINYAEAACTGASYRSKSNYFYNIFDVRLLYVITMVE